MLIICANLIPLYVVFGVIGFLILLLSVAGISISYYALNTLMKPKKRDDDFLINYETREKGFKEEWLDIHFIEKRLTSDFGYELFGRLYLNKKASNKIIFLLHGHNNSSIGQLKYLQIFMDLGYNVFIPDHRYSGKSQGSSISFGHYEKYDVIKWIDLILSEYPDMYLGLFGESMGAATAIMVTSLDKRVKFLIEYCGFANFEELSIPHVKYRLVYKILHPFFVLVGKAFFNTKIKETNALKAMKNINVPTLMMHSKADEIVPYENAVKLKAENKDAEMIIFEDSLHARSLMKYRAEYIDAIKKFIKKIESDYKIGG